MGQIDQVGFGAVPNQNYQKHCGSYLYPYPYKFSPCLEAREPSVLAWLFSGTMVPLLVSTVLQQLIYIIK